MQLTQLVIGFRDDEWLPINLLELCLPSALTAHQQMAGPPLPPWWPNTSQVSTLMSTPAHSARLQRPKSRVALAAPELHVSRIVVAITVLQCHDVGLDDAFAAPAKRELSTISLQLPTSMAMTTRCLSRQGSRRAVSAG